MRGHSTTHKNDITTEIVDYKLTIQSMASARERREKCKRKDPRIYDAIDEMYTVSEDGRVYSKKSEKYMTFCLSKTSGYMVVSLWYTLDGEKKRGRFTQHELVARKFIPNPDGLPVINHKDGDKTNNSIENLEWATYSANTKHAHDTLNFTKINKPVLQCDPHDHSIVIREIENLEIIRKIVNIVNVRPEVRKVCRAGGGMYGGWYWRYKYPEHVPSEGFDSNHHLEEWKELPNPQGGAAKYIFSNAGRVFSFHKNRYLSTKPIKGIDYVYIGIYGKQEYVHVIIADLFIPKPPGSSSERLHVNHKNGIKHDNRVENLEWVTTSENIKHAHRELESVCSKPIIQYSPEGVEIRRFKNSNEVLEVYEYPQAVGKQIRRTCNDPGMYNLVEGYLWRFETDPLTDIESLKRKYRPVKQYSMEGDFIREYSSISEASRTTKISGTTIGECCHHRRYPKLFIWRFSDDPPPRIKNGEYIPEKRVKPSRVCGKTTKPVNQYTLDGEFVKRWDTAKEAALSFGKPHYGDIYLMCNIAAGKTDYKGKIRHVSGYKWEFA